jgi:hypothetical protein
MWYRFKFKAGQLVADPRTRAAFILGTIVVAALTGAAVDDHGG